jgi:cold shock CspA family protein
MEPKLSISMRNIDKIEEVDDFIRAHLSELLKVDSHIVECKVLVDRTKKYRKSGNPFQVKVIVRFSAGPDIVVIRDPSGVVMQDPLNTTLHNAFIIVKRKIVERNDKSEQGGLRLQAEYSAVVSKLLPEKGYGFLQTDSGKSVFFHRSSVVGDEFDLMEEGMGVWFIEREGNKGLWASTVRIYTPAS